MGKEHVAKSFKSGNSVALRLPAAMKIEPGRTWLVVEQDGAFTVRPAPAPEQRKIDVSKFVGKAPWLKPLQPEDRMFEERELDWEGRKLRSGD